MDFRKNPPPPAAPHHQGDCGGEGWQLQIPGITSNIRSELDFEHCCHSEKSTAETVLHQAAQKSWSALSPSHPGLQRTDREHPHHRHHGVVWKHHTDREEGSAKSHKDCREDYQNGTPLHGYNLYTALSKKNRENHQRHTTSSSLPAQTQKLHIQPQAQTSGQHRHKQNTLFSELLPCHSETLGQNKMSWCQTHLIAHHIILYCLLGLCNLQCNRHFLYRVCVIYNALTFPFI